MRKVLKSNGEEISIQPLLDGQSLRMEADTQIIQGYSIYRTMPHIRRSVTSTQCMTMTHSQITAMTMRISSITARTCFMRTILSCLQRHWHKRHINVCSTAVQALQKHLCYLQLNWLLTVIARCSRAVPLRQHLHFLPQRCTKAAIIRCSVTASNL